ncbi:unnamed protein product [Amaranthus hypochondriacus]
MALKTLPSLFTLFTFLCLICNWRRSEGNDDPVFLAWKCDYLKGNYTENSTYHINLLNVFSNLTSLSISQKFGNLSRSTEEHDNTNKVYALYDCRRDLTLTTCHHCVVDATNNVLHRCPSLEAIVMYEECILRYANRPIVSIMEQIPYFFDCQITIPDGGELSRIIKPIFTNLIDEAVSNNSTTSKYFAAKKEDYLKYQKVSCLLQCTPDITQQECKDCLTEALNATLECGSSSGMVSYYIVPSCRMRYDVIRHLFNVSSSLPPMAMSSPPHLSPLSNAALHLRLFFSFKLIKTFLFLFFCFFFNIILI